MIGSSASLAAQRPSAALTAGPSSVNRTVQQGRPGLSTRNADVLASLALGLGVSQYDSIGLIEKCGICGKVYMSSVLREHILECPRR
jgi:hypothetical protein